MTGKSAGSKFARTALALVAISPMGFAAQPARDAAVWSPYNLIVDLDRMPRHYSCDALWYKFRDVLLSIGASESMQILPYECEAGLGALALSPRVHLRFSLPERVVRTGPRDAPPLRAVEKTVQLAPGNPRSLDDSDCALMKRIKDTLFAALPVHVVKSQLACKPSSSSFSISLQALVPEPGTTGVAPVHGTAKDTTAGRSSLQPG
jgi:hypothetical protein